MKIIVPDMDDVSLENPASSGLNWLYYLKGHAPAFKCTLFVIPGRSNDLFVGMLQRLSWIQVAMHGWNHDEKEKIEEWMLELWPGAKVYKGPNWKVTKEEMDLLHKHGFILAVKEKVDHPIPQWALNNESAVHGHCWIESDWEKLKGSIEEDTVFKFITEVV